MIGFRFTTAHRQLHGLPLATVDGIVQLECTQGVIVSGLEVRSDFLDTARVPVSAGARQPDLGLAIGEDLDEVVLGQPHLLAADAGRDVVPSVFLDVELRLAVHAVGRHRHGLVVQHEFGGRQRRIGRDLEIHAGAGDGADVTTGVLDLRRPPGPAGKVERELEIADARQVDDGNLVRRAARSRSGHEVLDRLAHREERELEAAVRTGHVDFLPVTVAHSRMHRCARRIKALHLGQQRHAATAPHGFVSRSHGNALRRQQIGHRPTCPQVPHAIRKQTGTRDGEPQ